MNNAMKKMMPLLLLVLLVLQITAISTEYWSVNSDDTANWGLWESCATKLNLCGHLPPDGVVTFPKNSLYAVRAFSVMSAVGLALCLLHLYKINSSMVSKKDLPLIMGASGVSALVAAIIWERKLNKGPGVAMTGGKLGYSYYLNVSVGVLALGLSLGHYVNMR